MQRANCHWEKDKLFSDQFEDVYYSAEDGLAETRHVFLSGNDIESRFAGLAEGETFTIAETGFGTGLNFLATLKLWQSEPRAGTLEFWSIEKYPVARADIAAIGKNWPELAPLAASLADRYNPSENGIYEIPLAQNAKLFLLVGDISEMLPQLPAHIDAWYLDGFAPDKNPQMWSAELFREMHKRADSQTTIATYTAAGVVKKALRNHGFKIKRLPGFGKKWHMLKAWLDE